MKLTRKNLRILLVDDNEAETDLLRISLARADFSQKLTHFKNGAIALEYFKYTKATGSLVPHVILLDLNMPLIDGVRALHRLREASSFRDLPVIILTGADDPAKRRELAELGIFRFLKKSADCANVISALDDFISFCNSNNETSLSEAKSELPYSTRGKSLGLKERIQFDLSSRPRNFRDKF